MPKQSIQLATGPFQDDLLIEHLRCVRKIRHDGVFELIRPGEYLQANTPESPRIQNDLQLTTDQPVHRRPIIPRPIQGIEQHDVELPLPFKLRIRLVPAFINDLRMIGHPLDAGLPILECRRLLGCIRPQ